LVRIQSAARRRAPEGDASSLSPLLFSGKKVK
jgi:hypothetical protein